MILHPDFPVVQGHMQLTDDWSLFLDQPHNRRLEDGDLVLWRPGFTLWIAIWNNNDDETIEERLDWIVSGTSPDAYDILSARDGAVFRYAYRLNEEREEDNAQAYYGFVIGDDSHVQIAVYFDPGSDLALAKAVVASVRNESP